MKPLVMVEITRAPRVYQRVGFNFRATRVPLNNSSLDIAETGEVPAHSRNAEVPLQCRNRHGNAWQRCHFEDTLYFSICPHE